MLESRPASAYGSTVGFTLVIGMFALDLGLIWLLFGSPITLLTFFWVLLLVVSLPVMGLLFYWSVAVRTARYYVAGNTLSIEWGGVRQVIPLNQIHTVVMGREMTRVSRFRGLRWPGFCWGQGYVRGEDGETSYRAVFFTTADLPQQLLLVTDTLAYVLSPADLENFRDCLVALRGANLGQESEVGQSNWGVWGWQLWWDRLAHGLWGSAVLLNGLLFFYLCVIYGRLPISVPLHFNALGLPDRMGTPANLFVLPLVGLITWLVNGVVGVFFYQWQQERPLALICWGTAVFIQLVVWGVGV